MGESLPRTAVLMCHAPIVIPPIGGTRGRACSATTEAMEKAARAVIQGGAGTVVVFSPHARRPARGFGFAAGEALRGDFSSFGAPEAACVFRADTRIDAALRAEAGVSVVPVAAPGLDHGSLVPLWFLQAAGFQGTVSVLGFPRAAVPGDIRRFGAALAAAMETLGHPWALVVSGDMSHALRPGAPGGFHPSAHAFDEAVVACVREGRLGDVAGIDPGLRDVAAEDVSEALEAAAGILGPEPPRPEVYSYEAPYGVGYCVALLRQAGP